MSRTVASATPIAAPVARPASNLATGAVRALLTVQGLYFLVTGIWPIVSIDTFQMVTGPKTDLWLVQTVGVLISLIAIVLLTAAWKNRLNDETKILAIGSALCLAGVDVVFVFRGVISPIYLADAIAEIALVIAWSKALSARHEQ